LFFDAEASIRTALGCESGKSLIPFDIIDFLRFGSCFV